MNKAKIYASGSVVGPIEVKTADLLLEAGLDKLDIPTDWIEKHTGIKTVRHCPDSVKPGDLAIDAAQRALDNSPLSADELDAVWFCGIERNCTEPATAYFVADAIGLDPNRLSLCWDLSDACHGFTAGLLTAKSFIESGVIRNALICTGERSSGKTKFIGEKFRKNELGRDKFADTAGAFTVGDAGGAMIIGASDDGRGIEYISTSNQPKHAKLCYFQDFGADRGIDPEFAMKMPQICARTLRVLSKMIPTAMEDLQWKSKDIDYGLVHQVGTSPYFETIKYLGIDSSKAPTTYDKYGNLTSATFPVLWDTLTRSGKLKPGQKVFGVSTGSGITASMLGMTA